MATNKNRGTFRAIGISRDCSEDEFKSELERRFTDKGEPNFELQLRLAPNCTDPTTQIAIFKLKPKEPTAGLPAFLWRNVPSFNYKNKTVQIDTDFSGLTQLYPVEESKIKIDIVAVSGLNSHAFGSWVGPEAGGVTPMWLQDFLGEDEELKYCRTMTYGYNTKYKDTVQRHIEDHARDLLIELHKARETEEAKKRRLIWIGHSLGGALIAHAVNLASFDANHLYKDIFDSMMGLFFFGVPFRNANLKDVDKMVNGDPDMAAGQGVRLLQAINYETGRITGTIDSFKSHLTEKQTKVYSFYETKETKKVIALEGGGYGRAGELIMVVERDSTELGVGSSLERRFPADGDHSTIVKLGSPQDKTYTTVCSQIKELLKEVAAKNAELSAQAIAEDREILKWISKINGHSKHDATSKRCKPGTGEWLLTSIQYRNWLGRAKEILFCPGIPGAGKTVLTSTVINDLLDKRSNDPSIGIAFIYFDFKGSAALEVEDLFSDLLKQLGDTRAGSLPKHFKKLFDDHKNSGRPPLREIIDALCAVVKTYSRVFIVLDALDEYQNQKERSVFLGKLFDMNEDHGINIYATSRRIHDIQNRFKKLGACKECEIRASTEDVKRYLEIRIDEVGNSSAKEHKETIKQMISERAQGMFLLAELQFDAIESLDEPNWKEIQTCLERFGTSSESPYDVTYQTIMNRICGKDPDIKKDKKASVGSARKAFQVLSWITRSSRHLTKEELQHAIAVEPGTNKIDKNNITNINDIISLCRGLVTYEEESNTVKLAHYTVQEYFERSWRSWFPHANSDIARACILYLSYDHFKAGQSQSEEEFKKRLKSNSLYSYAAKNWGKHTRDSWAEGQFDGGERSPSAKPKADCPDWPTRQSDTMSLVHNLLFKGGAGLRSACVQAMFMPGLSSPKPFTSTQFESSLKNQMPGSHIATYFGLKPVIEHLLEKNGPNLETENSWGPTLLSLGAYFGLKPIITRLLVKDGIGIEAKDSWGQTLLSVAAENGHKDLVELFLERGANCKSTDSQGQTPLLLAAGNGHKDIVEFLLEKGADHRTMDSSNRTPLAAAADSEHKEIVELLLAKGADPNVKDSDGRTPLMIAIEWGCEDIVEVFLRKTEPNREVVSFSLITRLLNSVWSLVTGQTLQITTSLRVKVDFNIKNSEDLTPLLIALGNMEPEIASLLVKNVADIDVNVQDAEGLTALHHAVDNDYKDVVKLLVEKKKADCNVQNLAGATPLLIVAENGEQKIASLLLEGGADPNIQDNEGQTPLSLAMDFSHQEIAQMLVEHGADPNGTDEEGEHILFSAIRDDDEKMIELLIEKQANLEVKNRSGETPLSNAMANGSKDIVKLLLKCGADPNVIDQDDEPILFSAISDEDEEIVVLLIEEKANLEAKKKSGETPLSYAMANRVEESIVKLLLEGGADPNAKDKNGEPILFAAISNDDEEIIGLLIKKKANLEAKNNSDETPLSYAIANQKEDIVKLLLKCKADPNANDENGEPMLFAAISNDDEEIISLLLKKGASPNSSNSSGQTLLFYAIENGNESAVKLLLENGADPEVTNDAHQTALAYAEEQEDESIISLLREKWNHL
ncbi:hypothetical protein TWF970_003676 [Orbilia oligospora]|uniref:Uncharacterized protein n=1 Tax=Orbilia oligospora TaxID=2813651 RepID=A0A7C8RJD9_ORBOL|nr:hypothetical protein TWF970_003676 [Orbilia oligospora]